MQVTVLIGIATPVVLRQLAFLPEIIENCDIIDTDSFFLDSENLA
jgi:hypothetical protein